MRNTPIPITIKQWRNFLEEQVTKQHYVDQEEFLDDLNQSIEDCFYERNIDWSQYHR